MEEYFRMVINVYRKAFDEYRSGNPIDINSITEVQKALNFAIDRTKMHNLPFEELEGLKNDVNHLKYKLI